MLVLIWYPTKKQVIPNNASISPIIKFTTEDNFDVNLVYNKLIKHTITGYNINILFLISELMFNPSLIT